MTDLDSFCQKYHDANKVSKSAHFCHGFELHHFRRKSASRGVDTFYPNFDETDFSAIFRIMKKIQTIRFVYSFCQFRQFVMIIYFDSLINYFYNIHFKLFRMMLLARDQKTEKSKEKEKI